MLKRPISPLLSCETWRRNMGCGTVCLQIVLLVVTVQADGEIRLVNGTHPWEGRVEIYLNGTWGTVCDDSWSTNDAEVVCRQIGLYTGSALAFIGAHIGEGSGSIILDDVRCRGNESRLTDCASSEVGTHNCGDNEGAGVSCAPAPSDGEIRLVNGQHSWEGRVEIYLNGTWGTVCDDFWNNNDAVVVCRNLGLNINSAQAFKVAHFGRGSSGILLDDVQCRGNESRLTDCPSNAVGIHNCEHSEDASVSCAPPDEGDIRLVNGTYSWEGRVEIYLNGTWGTVCGDRWDVDDAQVVCRQLGLYTNTSTADFGQGSGSIFLDEVECNGNESGLSHCPANAVGDHDCQHSQDAGVYCAPPADGELRLVNGQNTWEGRVEIYLTGRWVTVCHDYWDNNDADVVCRQLGLTTNTAHAFFYAGFGEGSGRILLDNVQCSGNESHLTDCPSNAVGNHNCRHIQDAGVSCAPPAEGEIRLVNGTHPWEGRVEVYLSGAWGTVCHDSWSNSNAKVVCRQLGLNTNSVLAFSEAHFGEGSGSILLDDVQCRGNESRLTDCASQPVGNASCGHDEDAGVSCAPTPECGDGYYGDGCNATCGNCTGGVLCSKVNGTCPTGCQPGFEPSDPRCATPCNEGTYGDDCVRQCGLCENGEACNTVTGHCSACQTTKLLAPLCQVCKESKHGSSCDKRCSALCGGDGSCDRNSRTCVQGCVTGYVLNGSSCENCPDGSYGDGCSSTCGNCAGDAVCDKVYGVCPNGCQPGFEPLYAHCKTRCSGGTYGDDCVGQCGLCEVNTTCDKVTGHCPSCQTNLLAPLCQVCAGRKHGSSCEKKCSSQCGGDGDCDRISGTCLQGCVRGYVLNGPSCEIVSKVKDLDVGIIVVQGVWALVLLLVVAAVVIFKHRRSRLRLKLCFTRICYSTKSQCKKWMTSSYMAADESSPDRLLSTTSV